MRKVWVVAADGGRARIFAAENAKKLVEVNNLEHPESRMPSRELTSDKPGRATDLKVGSPHMMQRELTPHMHEKDLFAEELAHFLEEGFNNGEFERLYLFANPQFSSLLHNHLDDDIEKLIAQEIHKDLTKMKPEDIREYLPPVL